MTNIAFLTPKSKCSDPATLAADLLVCHQDELSDLEFLWLGRMIRDLDAYGIPISEAEAALVAELCYGRRVLAEAEL
jgi:hypothetical protein